MSMLFGTYPSTCTTSALTCDKSRVRFIEKVPVDAVRLGGIPRLKCVPAQNVLTSRHHLQVGNIYAGSTDTSTCSHVVNYQSRWNRPNGTLVGETMRHDPTPAIGSASESPEVPIAVSVNLTSPDEAIARPLNLASESLLLRKTTTLVASMAPTSLAMHPAFLMSAICGLGTAIYYAIHAAIVPRALAANLAVDEPE